MKILVLCTTDFATSVPCPTRRMTYGEGQPGQRQERGTRRTGSTVRVQIMGFLHLLSLRRKLTSLLSPSSAVLKTSGLLYTEKITEDPEELFFMWVVSTNVCHTRN